MWVRCEVRNWSVVKHGSWAASQASLAYLPMGAKIALNSGSCCVGNHSLACSAGTPIGLSGPALYAAICNALMVLGSAWTTSDPKRAAGWMPATKMFGMLPSFLRLAMMAERFFTAAVLLDCTLRGPLGFVKK